MMFYTGIDIAKLNHFASVISNDSEVLIEPFQLFLNLRHTMATTLFDTSSLLITNYFNLDFSF